MTATLIGGGLLAAMLGIVPAVARRVFIGGRRPGLLLWLPAPLLALSDDVIAVVVLELMHVTVPVGVVFGYRLGRA